MGMSCAVLGRQVRGQSHMPICCQPECLTAPWQHQKQLAVQASLTLCWRCLTLWLPTNRSPAGLRRDLTRDRTRCHSCTVGRWRFCNSLPSACTVSSTAGSACCIWRSDSCRPPGPAPSSSSAGRSPCSPQAKSPSASSGPADSSKTSEWYYCPPSASPQHKVGLQMAADKAFHVVNLLPQ